MTSQFPDSLLPGPDDEPDPETALRGDGVGHTPLERIAIVEGVVIETTALGLLARVAGPGDIVTAPATGGTGRGTWATGGRFHRMAEGAASPVDLARRIRVLEARIDCLASHSGAARVADILSAIHVRSGEITISLTQQQLADLAGLRRATVNEAFQTLQKAATVAIRRGRIRIAGLQALEKAACGCDRRLRAHEAV